MLSNCFELKRRKRREIEISIIAAIKETVACVSVEALLMTRPFDSMSTALSRRISKLQFSSTHNRNPPLKNRKKLIKNESRKVKAFLLTKESRLPIETDYLLGDYQASIDDSRE